MTNPVKNYKFWIKIISAALLIALGFWIIFDDSVAKLLVLLITGLVIGIFSIIRTIPLLRTLKTKRSKLYSFLEIVIDLILAVYLIYSSFKMTSEPEGSFSKFNDQYYRFFIAFFFYFRAVMYFICTVLFKEETDKTKFWAHIILITLACFICALDNITANNIAITIAVIAFIASLGLIIEGASGYGRYRKMVVKQREQQKEKEEKAEDIVEVPTNEEIIPIIDESNNDSAQIC